MKDAAISPHIVLTPKTVRETSRQVFWLSLFCRPSQLIFNQWLTSAEALTPLAQGRDHSGGSAPDLHGIPFALMCRLFSCDGLYTTTGKASQREFCSLLDQGFWNGSISSRARLHADAAAAVIFCSLSMFLSGRPATPMLMVTLVASGQVKGWFATVSRMRAAAWTASFRSVFGSMMTSASPVHHAAVST